MLLYACLLFVYMNRCNIDSIRSSRRRELAAIAVAFAMLAVGCLVLTDCSDFSSAEPTGGSCGDSLTWSYNEGSKTLTISGTGAMTDYADYGPWHSYANVMTVIIIEEGCTHVGNNAFRGLGGVNSVTLPATSLQSIGDNAFLACYLVPSFSIGKNVSSIGSGAFNGCTEHLNAITVDPDNTHYCDVDGVLFTKDMKTLVKFPDGKYQENYDIPAGVVTVSSDAFQDNQHIQNISIPASVTAIQPNAFYHSTRLSNLTVDAGNAVYVSQDGALFNKSLTELIVYPMSNSRTSYTVPDSVTTLSANAFYANFYLQSINLPANLQHIGGHAFELTQGLNSITLPEKATDLGEALFLNSWVTSVTVEAKVEALPASTFAYSGITDVRLPNTLKSIGDSAFLKCTELCAVTIPNSVTSIGNAAFSQCTSLSTVHFPSSLKTIGQDAFSGCTALPHDVALPEGLTTIGQSAFSGCTNTKFVTLPTTVKTIGDSAFAGCSSLQAISLPEGLTTIGAHAFQNCGLMSYVVIPEGVTHIHDGAFDGCTVLSDIYIPTTVTTFGTALFSHGFYDGETELTMEQTLGKTFSYRYAKYQLMSGILLDSMGGSPVWPITGDAGSAANTPDSPSKAGCRFAGWFADKECTTPYVFDKIPAGSTFVYAKWDEISIRPPVNDDSPANYGIPMAILGAAIVGLARFSIAASLRRP